MLKKLYTTHVCIIHQLQFTLTCIKGAKDSLTHPTHFLTVMIFLFLALVTEWKLWSRTDADFFSQSRFDRHLLHYRNCSDTVVYCSVRLISCCLSPQNSALIISCAMTEVCSCSDPGDVNYIDNCLRGTVIERRSETSELSLSYARPAADG